MQCSQKQRERVASLGDTNTQVKNVMLLKAAVSHPLEFPERHHQLALFQLRGRRLCVHSITHGFHHRFSIAYTSNFIAQSFSFKKKNTTCTFFQEVLPFHLKSCKECRHP
jgi:hypothetical protein